MIFHWFRQNPRSGSMARLYGAIVAQARAEHFYRDCGVPDTVNGRFEMIVLHVLLVLRRLGSQPGRGPGQALFDLFCQDMDASLREIGIGDLTVPRQMQRIGEAFYGRQAAYQNALNASDPQALVAALARNVYGAADAPSQATRRLADYVRAAVTVLAEQDEATLIAGEVRFPDPAATAALSPVDSRQVATERAR